MKKRLLVFALVIALLVSIAPNLGTHTAYAGEQIKIRIAVSDQVMNILREINNAGGSYKIRFRMGNSTWATLDETEDKYNNNTIFASEQNYDPSTIAEVRLYVQKTVNTKGNVNLSLSGNYPSNNNYIMVINNESDVLSGTDTTYTWESCWNTFGGCLWKIFDDGTLTIKPGDATTQYASGQLPDGCMGMNFWPWFSQKENITKIVFEQGVKAGNSLAEMFHGCSSLTEIDFSDFDTSKAINMTGMFGNCSSLESLNLLKFNTANVMQMGSMFYSCSALQTLDLSSFDTGSVVNMGSTFQNCSALTTIYVSTKWDNSAAGTGGNTFKGCSSLKGGAETDWDSANVGANYARIDGGAESETPGYLTGKYTVTFDSNGGTGTMDAQSFIQGNEQALTKNAFTKTGYVFSCWMSNYGAAYMDGDKITTSDDILLNAMWTALSTINVTEKPAQSLIYNGTAQNLGSVTPDVDGCTISYKVDAGEFSTNAPVATNAGTYKVEYKVEKQGYCTKTGSFTVVIGKATPTAADFTFNTPSDLVYNGQDKVATVTSSKAGMGNITVYYSVDGEEWSIQPVKNAKTYLVAIDVAEEASYASATKLTSAEWTFTIEQREILVLGTTANSKTYDGTTDAVVNLGNVSGKIDGQDVTVTATGAFRNANAKNGEYVDITYTLSGTDKNNYKLSKNCNYTTIADINRKEVIVTAEDADKIYSEVDPEFTATVEGLLGTDTINYTVTRDAGEDVGTYAIFATGDASQGNYAVTYVGGTFTITQKELLIRADEISKVFGEVDPKLTVTFEGLVDGDDSSDIEYEISRSEGENVGVYKINIIAENSQGNYYVITESNTFAIYPSEDTDVKVDVDALKLIQDFYEAENLGAEVTVELQVGAGDANADDVALIQAAIGNKKLVSFDASLIVTVDGDVIEAAGSVNETPVAVAYKFDFTDKKDVEVYRVHEGVVEQLTETANEAGEYVVFDEEAGTITVYAKKYSTYAFAYNEVVKPASESKGADVASKTGDSNNIVLYIVIMTISAAAAYVLYTSRKRRAR